MMSRIRAFLELVRIPNAFTTPGDVIVGFALGGGAVVMSGRGADGMAFRGGVVWALLASALLYSGGMSLNDACDAAKDGIERPRRPIPSGRVSQTTAFVLAIGLMTAGVLAASLSSPRCLMVSLLLCGAIVSYDALLKNTPLAPAIMGGCRAMNIALGYAESNADWSAAPPLPFACMWLYVAGITYFARSEASSIARPRLVMGATAVVLACVGVALAALCQHTRPGASVHLIHLAAPAFAVSAWNAVEGFQAVRRPMPDVVQRCTSRFVLGIILFDAGMLWSMCRPWEAIIVAACLLPAVTLSRFFRVT